MLIAGADDPVGRAFGAFLHRLRHRQVGAGAEVPFAGRGQHDGAHREVDVRVLEVLDQAITHVEGDRVALVGAVDRQPQHAVLEARLQLFFDVIRGESGLTS